MVLLLATASKSFNKFAFFENQGILGWSIMLFADWLFQRLPIKSVFRIRKKSAFMSKLTTPFEHLAS